MRCGCGHSLGEVSFPLNSSYYHLRGSCKWLCCDQNWNEDNCTATGGSIISNVSSSSPSNAELAPGTRVELAVGYESVRDGADGPLRPGYSDSL